MSTLHKALESLSPRAWADIPQADELKPFLQDTFASAELVISSIPQQANGSPFESSTLHLTTANSATCAGEIHASSARSPDPLVEDLATLQKGWGKPVKIAASSNPLGMSVWKMAGNDRHGAWFARRSVHEGMGFKKWKAAMMREFGESLKVDGKPGEGSIRGIGADKRLEREEVDGVGRLEVYQLSAQFPGPVAPREFITCLLTSDTALTETSAATVGTSKHIPRHFMVVSIPIDHPEAPVRSTLVRGSYESIEVIREIPLSPAKSQSTPNLLNTEHEQSRARGLTVSGEQSDARSEKMDMHDDTKDDPETNPVEWIMVTRSDPGGGIPRFMVERNTPASIASDAVKFVNWAAALSEDPGKEVIPSATKEETPELVKARQPSEEFHAAATNGHLAGVMPLESNQSLTSAFEPNQASDGGIMASLSSTVASYVPTSVANRLGLGDPDDDSDSSDSDSTDSFNSFPETSDFKTAYEGPRTPDAMASTSSLSIMPENNGAYEGFSQSSDQRHYDRELRKLAERREALDEKMEKQKEADAAKVAEIFTKEDAEAQKQREKLDKERQKQEAKYKRDTEKLEAKKLKEERRIEAKKLKARDKDAVGREKREKAELGKRVELLGRENELLRRQMGDLQRENTLLVREVGKMGEGPMALKMVREELARGDGGRNRAGSVRSTASKRSAEVVGENGVGKLGVASPAAGVSEEVIRSASKV